MVFSLFRVQISLTALPFFRSNTFPESLAVTTTAFEVGVL